MTDRWLSRIILQILIGMTIRSYHSLVAARQSRIWDLPQQEHNFLVVLVDDRRYFSVNTYTPQLRHFDLDYQKYFESFNNLFRFIKPRSHFKANAVRFWVRRPFRRFVAHRNFDNKSSTTLQWFTMRIRELYGNAAVRVAGLCRLLARSWSRIYLLAEKLSKDL